MPAGIAYSVAARDTLRDVLGVEPPQPDLSLVFGELALALRDAAPPAAHEPRDGDPVRGAVRRGLVGARAARARAVRPGGHARGPRAARRAPRGVDRRTRAGSRRGLPAQRRRPLQGRGRHANAPSARRCSARPPPGTLGVVNAPGSGIADDKLVHAHVDELVRLYLDAGAAAALDPVALARTRRRARRAGGEAARRDGRRGRRDLAGCRRRHARAGARADRAPSRAAGSARSSWSCRSTRPPWTAGSSRATWTSAPTRCCPPTARACCPRRISRVALERGSMVVNSGQGGGAKDTWVPELSFDAASEMGRLARWCGGRVIRESLDPHTNGLASPDVATLAAVDSSGHRPWQRPRRRAPASASRPRIRARATRCGLSRPPATRTAAWSVRPGISTATAHSTTPRDR